MSNHWLQVFGRQYTTGHKLNLLVRVTSNCRLDKLRRN